jgi:hypothetical protein
MTAGIDFGSLSTTLLGDLAGTDFGNLSTTLLTN